MMIYTCAIVYFSFGIPGSVICICMLAFMCMHASLRDWWPKKSSG